MEEILGLKFNEKKGYFYLKVNNSIVAKMTFVFAEPRKIIIDHTEVNPEYNGKGFGKKMVEKAVLFAREKNLKILPLCPFAKKVLDKIPEYSDVL